MASEISLIPRSERQALIQRRLENSADEGEPIYDFRGGTLVPHLVKLEIGLPIYRLTNCRTYADQQNEISTKNLDSSFFSKGQESSTAQQVQHDILLKLAKRETTSVTPIMDVLRTDGQRDHILITSTGVVVNGNRRLSAMRELYRASHGAVDKRFSHVLCAVLPPDTTPDEIDDIEADLQARPQTKLDYDWIGDAQLIRRQVGKGRSAKEVADRLRRNKSEIENVLQRLDEVDLYLAKWVEKPGQYALVSGDAEQIFTDIPKNIANKDASLQDASRAIAWSLFENRSDVPGRIYSFNAAFGKLAPQVLELLADQLDLEQQIANDDEEADEGFDVDLDPSGASTNYQSIIDALHYDETKDDAVRVLIDVCEIVIERKKGKKSEKAALKALSQVNSKLTGIDVLTGGQDTLPAMLKQIETIYGVLDKMKENINARQKRVGTKRDADE